MKLIVKIVLLALFISCETKVKQNEVRLVGHEGLEQILNDYTLFLQKEDIRKEKRNIQFNFFLEDNDTVLYVSSNRYLGEMVDNSYEFLCSKKGSNYTVFIADHKEQFYGSKFYDILECSLPRDLSKFRTIDHNTESIIVNSIWKYQIEGDSLVLIEKK